MASREESETGQYLPAERDIESLRAAARGCRGCDLYELATQTVFGEGPARSVIFVGEQPGDQEDRQGRPFVGPAGKMLSSAMAQAGINRDAVYVTNAVKHFKWKPAGKRRIHETPRASEMRACLPWLEAEIEAVKPALLVCLGATATHSLLGPNVGVLANRGKVLETAYGPCLITIHPSALLRVVDADEQRSEIAAFVGDLGRGLVFLEGAAPEVAAKVRLGK